MDFVEKIRKLRRISSQYKFALDLKKSTQSYASLLKAKESITLRDLIALRRQGGVSDTELLNLIEAELKKRLPKVYSELPKWLE